MLEHLTTNRALFCTAINNKLHPASKIQMTKSVHHASKKNLMKHNNFATFYFACEHIIINLCNEFDVANLPPCKIKGCIILFLQVNAVCLRGKPAIGYLRSMNLGSYSYSIFIRTDVDSVVRNLHTMLGVKIQFTQKFFYMDPLDCSIRG